MDNSRKIVLKETGILALGEWICCVIMVCVFSLLGILDRPVVLGAVFGWLLTVANYFAMGMGTALAADKAQSENVAGGKNLLRGSMALRFVILAVLLFALAKSGLCNVFSLVIPLVFVRPVLLVAEFFRKKEG